MPRLIARESGISTGSLMHHFDTRERMLREICIALEAIATERPLLLVLEDVQWVDSSTVDLISAIARRTVTAKVARLVPIAIIKG